MAFENLDEAEVADLLRAALQGIQLPPHIDSGLRNTPSKPPPAPVRKVLLRQIRRLRSTRPLKSWAARVGIFCRRRARLTAGVAAIIVALIGGLGHALTTASESGEDYSAMAQDADKNMGEGLNLFKRGQTRQASELLNTAAALYGKLYTKTGSIDYDAKRGEAVNLLRNANTPPLLNAARHLALASASERAIGSVASAKDMAKDAVELLRKAADRDLIASEVETDPCFASLRGREDFQSAIRGLREKENRILATKRGDAVPRLH